VLFLLAGSGSEIAQIGTLVPFDAQEVLEVPDDFPFE
jgi:hypothetical protein